MKKKFILEELIKKIFFLKSLSFYHVCKKGGDNDFRKTSFLREDEQSCITELERRWITREYKKSHWSGKLYDLLCPPSEKEDIQLIHNTGRYLIVMKENFFATRYHSVQKFDGIPKKNRQSGFIRTPRNSLNGILN